MIKIGNTQITLNEEAGRALRSTSNQSSEPCQVAQYPQQRDRLPHAQILLHTATQSSFTAWSALPSRNSLKKSPSTSLPSTAASRTWSTAPTRCGFTWQCKSVGSNSKKCLSPQRRRDVAPTCSEELSRVLAPWRSGSSTASTPPAPARSPPPFHIRA